MQGKYTRVNRYLLLFVFLLARDPAICFAQEAELSKAENIFGIKGGIIGSGKFEGGFPAFFFSGGEVETKTSWTVGFFADQALNSSLSLGFYLDLHNMKTDSASEKMLDIGMALKGNVIRNKSKLSIRPGLAIGYGYLSEFGGRERLHFLNVKGLAEFYYSVSPKFKILTDFSLLGSPIGGYKNSIVNFGPIVLLRTGLSF